MYGSQKHKLLAQISRELDGILPPIDYETDPTIELDLKKKNKQQLIDVNKSGDISSDESSLVRLRSWSQRN